MNVNEFFCLFKTWQRDNKVLVLPNGRTMTAPSRLRPERTAFANFDKRLGESLHYEIRNNHSERYGADGTNSLEIFLDDHDRESKFFKQFEKLAKEGKLVKDDRSHWTGYRWRLPYGLGVVVCEGKDFDSIKAELAFRLIMLTEICEPIIGKTPLNP